MYYSNAFSQLFYEARQKLSEAGDFFSEWEFNYELEITNYEKGWRVEG